MNLVDRILTIVVTATITSAIWIVAGGSLIENATSTGQREATRPAEAAPSPSASDTSADGTGTDSDVLAVGALDAQLAAAPSAAQSRQLLIPVQNIRPADLTDTYSDSRGGGTRLHEALDIMAPKGTSVLSSAPGTIEKLFRSKAGGNTIYVRSTDGETIYYYAHLDSYAEGPGSYTHLTLPTNRKSRRLCGPIS